ncbi:MAG: hypothetical protein J2P57_02280 [Acidimicrobiaceae bacterium]|nr:hypothetical protein [Acidimicrobiaceae bacterium]
METLLSQLNTDRSSDRVAADEQTNWSDPAESITAEAGADAVAASLHERLQAIERAEQRVEAGTFGYSVRSGAPIPDERLTADPAAELTVEEASAHPER